MSACDRKGIGAAHVHLFSAYASFDGCLTSQIFMSRVLKTML